MTRAHALPLDRSHRWLTIVLALLTMLASMASSVTHASTLTDIRDSKTATTHTGLVLRVESHKGFYQDGLLRVHITNPTATATTGFVEIAIDATAVEMGGQFHNGGVVLIHERQSAAPAPVREPDRSFRRGAAVVYQWRSLRLPHDAHLFAVFSDPQRPEPALGSVWTTVRVVDTNRCGVLNICSTASITTRY